MNVLPWSLAPGRATIGVSLLLTTLSVGTLVALGGVADEIVDECVTVESADLPVRLNDTTRFPDTNGSEETTTASTERAGDCRRVPDRRRRDALHGRNGAVPRGPHGSTTVDATAVDATRAITVETGTRS